MTVGMGMGGRGFAEGEGEGEEGAERVRYKLITYLHSPNRYVMNS